MLDWKSQLIKFALILVYVPTVYDIRVKHQVNHFSIVTTKNAKNMALSIFFTYLTNKNLRCKLDCSSLYLKKCYMRLDCFPVIVIYFALVKSYHIKRLLHIFCREHILTFKLIVYAKPFDIFCKYKSYRLTRCLVFYSAEFD